ncbi:hypothetical protein SNEBB_005402 [Seison nebaliae]|nr:hypothetical protein SNEBB_005402 [Seison nebaliae]
MTETETINVNDWSNYISKPDIRQFQHAAVKELLTEKVNRELLEEVSMPIHFNVECRETSRSSKEVEEGELRKVLIALNRLKDSHEIDDIKMVEEKGSKSVRFLVKTLSECIRIFNDQLQTVGANVVVFPDQHIMTLMKTNRAVKQGRLDRQNSSNDYGSGDRSQKPLFPHRTNTIHDQRFRNGKNKGKHTSFRRNNNQNNNNNNIPGHNHNTNNNNNNSFGMRMHDDHRHYRHEENNRNNYRKISEPNYSANNNKPNNFVQSVPKVNWMSKTNVDDVRNNNEMNNEPIIKKEVERDTSIFGQAKPVDTPLLVDVKCENLKSSESTHSSSSSQKNENHENNDDVYVLPPHQYNKSRMHHQFNGNRYPKSHNNVMLNRKSQNMNTHHRSFQDDHSGNYHSQNYQRQHNQYNPHFNHPQQQQRQDDLWADNVNNTSICPSSPDSPFDESTTNKNMTNRSIKILQNPNRNKDIHRIQSLSISITNDLHDPLTDKKLEMNSENDVKSSTTVSISDQHSLAESTDYQKSDVDVVSNKDEGEKPANPWYKRDNNLTENNNSLNNSRTFVNSSYQSQNKGGTNTSRQRRTHNLNYRPNVRNTNNNTTTTTTTNHGGGGGKKSSIIPFNSSNNKNNNKPNMRNNDANRFSEDVSQRKEYIFDIGGGAPNVGKRRDSQNNSNYQYKKNYGGEKNNNHNSGGGYRRNPRQNSHSIENKNWPNGNKNNSYHNRNNGINVSKKQKNYSVGDEKDKSSSSNVQQSPIPQNKTINDKNDTNQVGKSNNYKKGDFTRSTTTVNESKCHIDKCFNDRGDGAGCNVINLSDD